MARGPSLTATAFRATRCRCTNAVPLDHGLRADRALAPPGTVRPAVRVVPRELRRVPLPQRIPARDAEGLRRPVCLPDHEPDDDRCRGRGHRGTNAASAPVVGSMETR